MPFRPAHAALVGLTLAAATMLFAFDPAVTRWFPSCPLYALTGWLCPFCGSLRALHALLHGNVAAAAAFNPLTTAVVGAGLIAGTHDAMRRSSTSLVDRLVSRCFSMQGLACAVIFGVVRNMR
jgi:hypothetical protein